MSYFQKRNLVFIIYNIIIINALSVFESSWRIIQVKTEVKYLNLIVE